MTGAKAKGVGRPSMMRGTCGVCGYHGPLKVSGKVRRHDRRDGDVMVPCEGSDQLPVS